MIYSADMGTPKEMLDLAKYHAERGHVNVANMDLGSCEEAPMSEKLGILADAYERQARVNDVMAEEADREAKDAYIIPPWELEAIGNRAIAQHLREQATKLDPNQSATIAPKK